MAAPAIEQESVVLGLEREIRELLRPPPKLTGSQWADKNFHMSAEDGGKWKTLPYQREILDAMTDGEIERVTVMKSARIGYTKMLCASLGYYMQHDPASMIVVQPTVEDSEGFSKKEIAGMLRDNRCLDGIVADPKSRDSNNTILAKEYLGRTLYMVGANSGRGFRRIHARRAYCDEIDAYPPSAGSDGDQIELAWIRTQEAKLGRGLCCGSTPLDAGASRIERSYLESDQRRYMVACPECDHEQRIEWGGKDFDYGIKWPKGEPEAAYYLCAHCHCVIEESAKRGMIDRGRWIADKPFRGHAGFHIWAGYSLSPNATWGKIASEWDRLHGDPTTLKIFVNTWLGQTWKEQGRSPKGEALAKRREEYPTRIVDGSPEPEIMVPSDGVVLTSFTDVQLDRLEVGIEAWGLGEENWKLEYHVLYGDPTAEPIWKSLWELISRVRMSQRGVSMFVRSSCIDSGYASQSVYGFVRPRPVYKTHDGRTAYTWATKGVTGTGNVWPNKPSVNTIGKCPIYPVKVDTAKDHVAARLTVDKSGPGYSHFPSTFDEGYFAKLASEHAVDTRDKRGFPVRTWKLKEGHKRNEPWDCVVGNYAALCALYSMGFNLERESLWIDARTPGVVRSPVVEAEVPKPEPRRVASSPNWLGADPNWLRR